MIIPDIQDTIKQYLDGTLSPQEKAKFEHQIKSSDELAEEIRRFRQLHIFDKNRRIIEANALLSGVMAEIDIEPDYGKYEKYFKKSIFENTLWRWLFVGLILLAVISGTIFYQKIQMTNELKSLSISHLQPMENIIGFSVDDQRQAAKGMKAYDQQNYTEAIKQLQFAIKEDPNDKSLRLYLAISYLIQEQNEKAENLLEEIVKANDLSTIPAKWYLALSFLQDGKKEEAKKLLIDLDSDASFGIKAKEIIGHIR